jgi:hypothetical protein
MQELWGRKGVLPNLSKAADYRIIYRATDSYQEGFAVSDYVADHDKRLSTGGYVFLMAGSTVICSSKLLPNVATSTMRAEYIARGN